MRKINPVRTARVNRLAPNSTKGLVPSAAEGFSIIEVLIFTLLSSMVLIAMSYATLLSVRNSRESQNRTRSTRYMQQAQEWLRGQKEVDWNVFVGALSEDTYCLNSTPDVITDLNALSSPCAATDFSLTGGFKRELVVSDINVDQTEVTYTVYTYWRDAQNIQKSQVSSLLAQWE